MVTETGQRFIEKISIEDVVEHYMHLTRASVSGKTLKCRCPFHHDEFKSMMVRKVEQIFECKLCGMKGNAYDFISLMEGCCKKEARKIAIQFYETGIISRVISPVGENAGEEQDEFLSAKVDPTYKMIADSLETCHDNDADIARTKRCFGVGFAPGELPSGFKKIIGKLVYPVRDIDHRIYGLVYRESLDKHDYKFYPREVLDTILYGWAQAIDEVKRLNFVYLVEDCEDVLTMHSAGFSNTIGNCDNLLKFRQVRALAKQVEQAVLFYHDDFPGQASNSVNAARLSYAGVRPVHICLPPDMTLSDLYKKLGKKRFVHYIRQSTRLGRLNTLRNELSARLDELFFEIEQTDSIAQKAVLRSQSLPLQSKLNKILFIMGNYPVRNFSGK